MLRTIPVLLMLAFCGGASAQEMYRCTIDGKVNYSSSPCKTGTMKAIPVPPAPKNDPQHSETLRRQQATLATLTQARMEREAKEKKAQILFMNNAKEERCTQLKADKAAADDNAAQGPGFNRASRRAQADKIGEVLAAECGS
jgi:hypothetical protein